MEENLPRHRANSRKARQETSIMYACAAEGPLSGKISLKCTLGQPILAGMAYFVLFKMGKRCRGVHLANISPERSGFLARAYIMLVSCHSVMFCPPVRVLWVLGATGSYPLEEIFPRAGALGTLGVDGAVAAAISEPLMRGVFPGVGGIVAVAAFKSPVRGCAWPLDLPA